MQVKIIAFGVLRDWLGASGEEVQLPVGTTVAELLNHLRERLPADAESRSLRGIAVGVNAEYAEATTVLQEGDEVALLPPVSGGNMEVQDSRDAADGIRAELTRERIDAEKIVAASKHPTDGAVVVFDGIVRNHSRRRETRHLDYEAYEAMALKQMRELCELAREKFGIRLATIIHRLGRLDIGDTSVLIVVASAHRNAAFDACRWMIDTLKQTVPIWKRETFIDGTVWAPGEPFPDALAIDIPEARRDA